MEDGFTKVNQDSFLVLQNQYNLKDFNIFAAKQRISSDLASSHLTLKGNYDANDRIIDVKSILMSLAKDSLTSVIIRGHITDPTFYITALLRGAIRPGIDESAIENEEYYTAEDGTVLKVKAKKLSDKPNIHASDKDQVSIHSDD